MTTLGPEVMRANEYQDKLYSSDELTSGASEALADRELVRKWSIELTKEKPQIYDYDVLRLLKTRGLPAGWTDPKFPQEPYSSHTELLRTFDISLEDNPIIRSNTQLPHATSLARMQRLLTDRTRSNVAERYVPKELRSEKDALYWQCVENLQKAADTCRSTVVNDKLIPYVFWLMKDPQYLQEATFDPINARVRYWLGKLDEDESVIWWILSPFFILSALHRMLSKNKHWKKSSCFLSCQSCLVGRHHLLRLINHIPRVKGKFMEVNSAVATIFKTVNGVDVVAQYLVHIGDLALHYDIMTKRPETGIIMIIGAGLEY